MEINDQELLFRIDRIIAELFGRLKAFGNQVPKDLKRLSRSYYEARYKPTGGYIRNYNDYGTTAEKLRYLADRGYIDPSGRYDDVTVSSLFEQITSRRLAWLEEDVGVLS